MSLQVLHPQMNQWVPPHLGQQYYYPCEAPPAIQHWSNISPRESESEDSDGSSCHSSVGNPSPRYGIFDTSLTDQVHAERSVSPTLSERSGKKTPTCLGILDEMEELSLTEDPPLPKVNIPAETMAYVQQANIIDSGLSVSAPPTPREASTAGRPWMGNPRSSSANTTPNVGGVMTPTEYAPVGTIGVPASSNGGVFAPTQRRSRHPHQQQQQQHAAHQQQQAAYPMHQQHQQQHQSMMYLQDQLQQIHYHQQQQHHHHQYQYAQYMQQQQAAAAAYQHMAYGYPQQSYAYPTGMTGVQANAYGCM